MQGIAAGDAMTDFTITTGMMIDCEYMFQDDIDGKNPVGAYDMKVGYRFSEEEILLENVLTITQE